MLVLDGIAKAFGPWRALAGVSLTVGAGEAVLLVGRNGAGKTTLLRIATGFLEPDAGSVTIDGVAMATRRNGSCGILGSWAGRLQAHFEQRAALAAVAGCDRSFRSSH